MNLYKFRFNFTSNPPDEVSPWNDLFEFSSGNTVEEAIQNAIEKSRVEALRDPNYRYEVVLLEILNQ